MGESTTGPHTQSQADFRFEVRKVDSGYNGARSSRKIGPPPTAAERCRRPPARDKFQVSHLSWWTPICQEARHARSSPEGSHLAAQLNTPPGEMEGEAATWTAYGRRMQCRRRHPPVRPGRPVEQVLPRSTVCSVLPAPYTPRNPFRSRDGREEWTSDLQY